MHVSLNTNDLRTLVVLSRSPTLKDAASALGMNAQNLSRTVHRLEKQLGTTLFTRRNRKLVLTAAGLLLAERSQMLLDLLHETVVQIEGPESARQRFRIRPHRRLPDT